MNPIHLGMSPCPNDTFLLHGLLADRVDRRGLDLRVELADVEELNRRLLAGEFDVAKASFHAALLAADRIEVLPVGSALGFGVGPLLLAAAPGERPSPASPGAEPRVLCPGEHTTATLLYRLFHASAAGSIEQVVFSAIMPALEAGSADFGVCIHEGRFTYTERGLFLVEDLGERWERETKTPLPLGGLVVRKRLAPELVRRVNTVLRDSLDYGLAHREEALGTMREHAQELSEEVLFAHVDLYVNAWTKELGEEGRAALAALGSQAAAAGLITTDGPPLEVADT